MKRVDSASKAARPMSADGALGDELREATFVIEQAPVHDWSGKERVDPTAARGPGARVARRHRGRPQTGH
jgi:hypothetical protein